MSDGTTRHFADEAAAAGKSATVADLITLVERTIGGCRLAIELLELAPDDHSYLLRVDGKTYGFGLSTLRDASYFEDAAVELITSTDPQERNFLLGTLGEMRWIALNQLKLRQQPQGKNENASYLPEATEEAPDRALLEDLMALPASQLVEVFAEICITAGIPPHQRAAFSSALMQRLTPDKPLSAREVLAKTLFRQRGKGEA